MDDDTRTEGQAGRHRIAVAIGPGGDDFDWYSIDWAQVEDEVRRLRPLGDQKAAVNRKSDPCDV
jgi:hypothetical protein